MRAGTVGHLHFRHRQAETRGAQLHLKGPSPVAVVHRQAVEGGKAHGAERRQVPKATAEEEAGACQDESVPPAGVGAEVAGRALRPSPDAQHQVGPLGQRDKQGRDALRALRVIRVHEDDGLGRRLQRAE